MGENIARLLDGLNNELEFAKQKKDKKAVAAIQKQIAECEAQLAAAETPEDDADDAETPEDGSAEAETPEDGSDDIETPEGDG